MRKLFVEELYYKLLTTSEISFHNPPDIIDECEEFKLTLHNGDVTVVLKKDGYTEEQARIMVESKLRAWELDSFLQSGRKTIRFEFLNSKVKMPPQDGNKVMLLANHSKHSMHSNNVSLHCIHEEYPSIPQMIYSSEVKTMAERYESYSNGNEPLLSMAYFCFTFFISSAPKPKKGNKFKPAAEKYNVDEKVLIRLSRLTSAHGDMKEARKFNYASLKTPLTEAEKTWINEVIKALIRRKSEYDFNSDLNFQQINQKDLPPVN
jgi:hypothetical protein